MDNELARIVDALPGLVWTALPDGNVDFLNRRWCEYTGLTVDEARGRGWQITIHPDDLPDVSERWRSILAAGEPAEMETRLRRVDGEYRWFHVRTRPLIDASGQIVKWCGMNTDIEDRTRAEDALHAYDGRFRFIIDGLPTLVSIMKPDGELEHANHQVLEYFNKTLEELKEWATSNAGCWPPTRLTAMARAKPRGGRFAMATAHPT